jgi:hypothetical protein
LPPYAGYFPASQFGACVGVREGLAYFSDGSWMKIIDVSHPKEPELVSVSKINGLSEGITVREEYAYMTDHYYGLCIFDISNPKAPVAFRPINMPGSKWDVVVSGDYAFVADGPAGLQVVDVSNPLSPYVPTPPSNTGAGGWTMGAYERN